MMKKIILLLIFSVRVTNVIQAQQWFTLDPGFASSGQYDRVNALCADTIHNVLWTGGRFLNTYNGVTMNNLAYWDGINWKPFVWHQGLGTIVGYGGYGYEEVTSLLQFDSLIAIGGKALTLTAGGVSLLDLEDSAVIPLGSFNDEVKALCIYHDTLYAGGRFSQCDNPNPPYNSNSTYGIAKWNGTDFVEVGGGVGGQVNAMCVHNGKLIAAGEFENAGGIYCKNIAQWDGTAWSPIGIGIGQSGTFDVQLLSVCSYKNKIFAGGDMMGTQGNDLVVWNGSSWTAAQSSLNDVYSLGVAKDKLFVGASTCLDYWQSTTPWYYCAAQFNDTTWQWTGKGPVYNSLGTVMSFAEWNDSIYVGGKFKYLGDTPYVYAGFVARYNPLPVSATEVEIKQKVSAINIYPNPAQSSITIESADGKTINQVTVTDVLGEAVQSLKWKVQSHSDTINISVLSAGVYFIKVQLQDGSVTVRKFVKE